jgi:hypothetical protein
MKKLTLDPDQLRVQSFAADDAPPVDAGTVHAREATVTCIYPRCGNVAQRESGYNVCTYDNC